MTDYDYSISQKTFKRDLELIAELMKIEIEFDHSIKKYKIIVEEKSEISLFFIENCGIKKSAGKKIKRFIAW